MTEKTPLTIKSAGELRRARYLFRREQGQSALEFLLILPVFVTAFLLVVDFGMMMYQYVSVSNAVREGARFGAINCGDGSCQADATESVSDRTIARSSGSLDPLSTSVTVGWLDNDIPVDDNRGRGDSVVVKVNHDYNFIFFPATITVVSCADMSLEQIDAATSLPAPPTGGC